MLIIITQEGDKAPQRSPALLNLFCLNERAGKPQRLFFYNYLFIFKFLPAYF